MTTAPQRTSVLMAAALIVVNVAADVEGRPWRSHNREAAFYALTLDRGPCKGDLCGLHWSSLDLAAGKMRIFQQLVKPGPTPQFGPPKNGQPRTVSLAAETITLLKAHKRHQARIKMANRTTYADHGLVFAKEWSDVGKRGDCLGHPLQINYLGQREYAHLITAAKVRPIKFHGLRHTCATLLLQAGNRCTSSRKRLGP